MNAGNPDELLLSRSRVRREIESLRDLLEKTNRAEPYYDNIRGQIAMLRRVMRPEGLDGKREFDAKPQTTKTTTEPEPKLYD
jgi:hypothetical protein